MLTSREAEEILSMSLSKNSDIDDYQDEDIAIFNLSYHTVYIIIYGGLPSYES